jgi:hypothetical protein
MLDRSTLEDAAVKLLGTDRKIAATLTDRQIGEALLRKLAPLFNPAGRSDDAIAAAAEHAVFSALHSAPIANPQPTSSGFAEIPGTVDNFFKAQGVPTISSVTQRPDSIDAQLRELEEKRLNAWRPPRP